MGVKTGISIDTWPEQGECLGNQVSVCFCYDTRHVIDGEIVRNDVSGDSPVTIIKLADGRYVLDSECQYSLKC